MCNYSLGRDGIRHGDLRKAELSKCIISGIQISRYL